jgi:hypothetical protein
MTRRSCITAISAAGMLFTASAFARGQLDAAVWSPSGYAPINGLKMYYEIH